MTRTYTHEELLALVSDVTAAAVPGVGPLKADSPLIGELAVVDSVGLVTLLVGLEERLQGAVDLAASFMAFPDPDAPDHPFRTVGSLAVHLHAQLGTPCSSGSVHSAA